MQMTTKVELIKRFDEHDCILTWSAQAPGSFILAAIDDFKSFIQMKLKEQEDQKIIVEKIPESEKVKEQNVS
jgi:hypothetical protein